MATFYFEGHETIGSFVRGRLEAAEYFEVTDPTEADIIVTYFVSADAAESAYLETEGLLQIAQQDALLIDLSPLSPSFARELSALAQISGLFFVEAPLAVKSTTLPDAFVPFDNVVCCVAGTDDALAAANPVLKAMFSQIHACGSAGAAQLAHAAYAVQLSSLMVASAEAFALFQADRGDAADALGTSEAGCGCAGSCTARPPALTEESVALVDALADGRFEGSFTSEMLRADLSAALSAAEDAELTLPAAEVCLHLLELLAVAGGSDLAPIAVSLDYASQDQAAAHGLDWERASELYAHGHDDDDYDDDEYDDGGYR